MGRQLLLRPCSARQRLSSSLGLLGEQHSVDVGQHTAGSDGHSSEQLIELLVVADGKLDVTWDDTTLLVVAGSVASKLKDLGGQVLEDGSKVHWGTGADAGTVAASAEVTVDATHRELKAGLGRAGG
jgi:hypothetical protein